MNANELADWIDEVNIAAVGSKTMTKASNMLRQFDLAQSIIKQQQIQIENLEKEVKLWQSQAIALRSELGFKWTGEIRQWSQE
jgi:kynurenine formamidase